MPQIAMYKIPRKRKTCLILYRGELFHNADELKAYLLTEKNFTPHAAEMVVSVLPIVDEDTIKESMSEFKISKTKQKAYLVGEDPKPRKRKAKTA